MVFVATLSALTRSFQGEGIPRAVMGFAVAGLMLFGFFSPWAILRACVALILVFIVPGAWVARRFCTDPVQFIPLAFCLSLLLLIPAGVIGYPVPLHISA